MEGSSKVIPFCFYLFILFLKSKHVVHFMLREAKRGRIILGTGLVQMPTCKTGLDLQNPQSNAASPEMMQKGFQNPHIHSTFLGS